MYWLLDFDVSVADPAHDRVIQNTLPVFLCPAETGPRIIDLDVTIDPGGTSGGSPSPPSPGERRAGRNNYSGVFGTGPIESGPGTGNGAFYSNSDTLMSDFKDGQSNTIIYAERTNELGTVSWVGVIQGIDEPYARIVGSARNGPNDPENHFEDFRSYHSGGINVVLRDGSTHFIKDTIRLETFQSLTTVNGGEVVSIKDDG